MVEIPLMFSKEKPQMVTFVICQITPRHTTLADQSTCPKGIDGVAVMTNAAVDEANQAFGKQISNQVSRITGELRRLESLLTAGMVDRRVLSEFRHVIDRVRTTGWQVQTWLEGDEQSLSQLVTQERVRVVTTLANQLASDPEIQNSNFSGLTSLHQAIQKLDKALQLPK